MKMNVNSYKELLNTLINGSEKIIYMYNKNELICTCYNKDIRNITIINLINCEKLHVIIGRCIINCDEIIF